MDKNKIKWKMLNIKKSLKIYKKNNLFNVNKCFNAVHIY